MERKTRRVALREVAQRAGVSLGTASNVLAGRTPVAPERRAAVIAAATELGYQPRPRRTASAQRPVGMIGLILRRDVDQLFVNPFYSHVLHGAQVACAARRIGLAHETVAGSPNEVPRLPLMVQRKQVDGLLVLGYVQQAVLAMLRSAGVPFVLIDYDDGLVIADSVCGDDDEGGYLATRYLLDHGHRDPVPACIAGPLIYPSLRDRVIGYRRALAEAGLIEDEAYVRAAAPLAEHNLEHAAAAMSELLDLPRPPTAVFCTGDMDAIGALKVLRDRGCKVPEECSIVSYDDITLAAHTAPPLTTIRIDKELLGAQGIWHLLERIEFPDMPLRQTRVAVRLIERASVAPRGEESGRDHSPG